MSFDAKRLNAFRKLHAQELRRAGSSDSYARQVEAECFRLAAALIAGELAAS